MCARKAKRFLDFGNDTGGLILVSILCLWGGQGERGNRVLHRMVLPLIGWRNIGLLWVSPLRKEKSVDIICFLNVDVKVWKLVKIKFHRN